MIVYHGSVLPISRPDLAHTKTHVDFGPGFYVTTFKEQAERWALRRAMRMRTTGIVSVFDFNESMPGLEIRRFVDADREWLDFVASCRRGVDMSNGFDVIIGQVADDAVFEAVNMYLTALWDAERTLTEIRYYKRNDQIVFKTETALTALSFQRSYGVEVCHG